MKKVPGKIRALILFTFFLVSLLNMELFGQSPCMPAVPAFTINMTGKPDSVWSSPNVSRNDQCCTATSPDQCIYFNLTLDPNVAGIQIDMIGADPAGSLFYDINCTGSYPGGTLKCISGVGPHQITFCKPGGNKNVYKITSVAKPIFPADTSVRIGCKRKLITYGIVNSSVVWTAINSSAGNSPAQLAFFNTFLDSLNVASPTYSAPASATNLPAWVEYSVCGYPQASACGFSLTVCDVVRVWNIQKLNVVVTPSNPTFCGAGAVTLTANLSGGLAPYSYSWTVNSMTAPVIGSSSILTATTGNVYYVRVFDKLYNSGNCPFTSAQVQPTVGVPPTATVTASQKVCKSNPLATVSGTVLNPVSYTWTTSGDGSFSTPNFTTSNYTPGPTDLTNGVVTLSLTVTGGSGCGNITQITKIYYSPSPSVTISSGTLACFNSTTALVANAIGGITSVPYQYLWSNTNSLTANNTLNVGGGNYSVIVYDSLGCSGSANINVNAPTALNLLFAVINNTVNGGNNGSATVTAGGGTPGYSVLWAPGSFTTMAISSLTFGIYTATVTDANGCEIVSSTIVNEPRCLAFSSAVSATNVSCYKSTDGIASVTVSGGSPSYSYTWNTVPAQNTSVATGLNAGVYSVLISDSNSPSCYQTANVTVTEPSPLSTTMTHTDVTTMAGNDGAAAVFVTGGTPVYSYLWSTSATTNSISNLVAGSYSVTVTDAKGCTKPDYVLINQPPCNNLVINVLVSNPLCNGGFGSAQAFVSGAVGTPTITWSNAATGISSGPLTPGSYTVTVDTKTCVEIQTFDVVQPSALSLGLLPTNISCADKSDGSINITVGGGTIPYTYTWSTGSNAEDLTGLSGGTYTVLVKDANGCTTIGSAFISKPSPLTYSATTIQSVSCVNGTNGSIALTVNGGIPPYTYSWSTSATTPSISNLSGGGYTVVVKDANNCIGTPPYLIIGISTPDSVKVGTFSIACSVPGSSLTQVFANPSGGLGSYSVSYNGGTYIAAATPTMLVNGQTYTVTAKDVNGCISPLSQTLSILNEVKITGVTYTNCYSVGTTTTQVVVTPGGGDNGPYQLSTDNGATYLTSGSYTFNAAVASSYSIIVKDARGCVSAMQVISLPSVLDATAAVTSNYNGQNISCFGSADGTASVTATGGTGVYTYTWNSIPSQNAAAAVNLGAGSYSVIVKDGNNCSVTRTVILVAPTAISATAGVSSNYNGQNISCFGSSDGSATVSVSGATSPYTYQWNSIPSQTTSTASNLSAGLYSVVVKDINNCAVTKTVVLTQPVTLTSTTSITSNYNGQNISCFGLSDGSASVATSGGTGAYSYTWTTTPAQNTASASALSAGAYSVTVADMNGCSVVKTVTLVQPTQIAATTSITSNYNGQNISCFGLSDGSASVAATGGTGVYTYTWSTIPAQNTSSASALVAGLYSVTVNDVNGCSLTKTVSLTQPAVLASTAGVSSNYNGQNISCFGLTDGSATVAANGGTGVYSYTWTSVPTQSTSTANNLGAGMYSITVSDINGCSIIQTVTLTQPTAISATAAVTSNYNGQNISCFGYNDGTASVTASGATSPYTYQWNTLPIQTTTNASNLSAGTYSVIVKDINNCAITKTVSLTQPVGLSSTIGVTSNYNGQDVTCFGANNGSAAVTVTNGTGPYTYTWSTIPVQTSSTANNIGAGVYSVTIADVNGCVIINTITITQPSQLLATTSVISNYNGQDISCFGTNDGAASVMASGATAPYTYSWTTVPAQTNAAALGLAAGNYSVQITDVNGCAATQTVALTQPAPVSAVVTSTSNYNGYNISCFGLSNGNIDISVSGGTGAFTYTWSNNANTQDINNLGVGSYSVIATDVNGCADTLFVILTQPSQLVVTIDSLSNFNGYNVSCNGSSNGTVYVSVNGGVANYSYSWSNGTTNQNLINVGVGSYFLNVVDMNNCFENIDTLLVEPSVLINSYSVSQPLCNGVSNGSIDLTVGGGVAPFTYTWSNNTSNEDLSNITSGTYSVVFTDANGCSDSLTLNVTQPQNINMVKEVDRIKCYGDTTAAVQLNINGGTTPYTFNWSNGKTTQNISSIGSGTYIVTITDANGCQLKDTTRITQPAKLELSLNSPLHAGGYNISTYNGNDGAIDLSVSGGVGPYTYNWSNGSTSEDLSNLTAPFPNPYPYFVIVTDSNGCKQTAEILLTQPLLLEMPTGYSPNGDSKNDYFVVHGIEAFPSNVITIYNRWGNIVYNKNEYKNEWDGRSNNGSELPEGTYFVILEIDKGTKTEIILKGYVELRRN